MHLEWPNGVLRIGECRMRGPGVFSAFLAWNQRLLIEGTNAPLGELRHMDHIECIWRWPCFRGVRLHRYAQT